jgi:hypothetical protein
LRSSPGVRFRKDTVLIVDGTLVPTRDRAAAASSKNYRYSTNHQVVIDADTRLVVTVAKPPQRLSGLGGVRREGRRRHHPRGDRRRRAPGRGLTIPHYRRPKETNCRPGRNTTPPTARSAPAHTFARLKSWKILRDCRLRGDCVHHAMLGVARLHNLTLTG